jgi:hypothetical protein
MKVDYKRDYISNNLISGIEKNKIDDLIIMTNSDEDISYTKITPTTNGFDTPLAHSMSTLTLPIGEITKEVTYEFYNQYFEKASKSNDINLPNKNFSGIIISPKVENFNYSLPFTNIAFTMTPHISFILHIKVYKNTKLIMEKSYNSGIIYGETSIGSSLYEDTSKAFHKGLFNLYKIVNQDVVMAVSNN